MPAAARVERAARACACAALGANSFRLQRNRLLYFYHLVYTQSPLSKARGTGVRLSRIVLLAGQGPSQQRVQRVDLCPPLLLLLDDEAAVL